MSGTLNRLGWMHPLYGISTASLPQVPLPSVPAQQVHAPLGMLPGSALFAGMTPEQQFWFAHLMGHGVGQGAPPSQVNPYFLMSLLQGPQGAIQQPEPEE